LRRIPTVGSSSLPFLSLYGAYKFLRNGSEMFQTGYDKYKGCCFKIASPISWHVVVSGTPLVEELRNASEEDISFHNATQELLQFKYVMGPEIESYHAAIVRTQLTNKINATLPDLHDEMGLAFADALARNGNDWQTICATDVMHHVVCRVSGRVFVGLPLCANKEYCDLMNKSADFFRAGFLLAMFPEWLRPVVSRYSLRSTRAQINRAENLLRPLIMERLQMHQTYGDHWQEKPSDVLQWMIDTAANEKQRTVHSLTLNVLNLNNAAIQTTSITLTHALVQLATHPQYAQPLREEIDIALRKDGWTKTGIVNMRKLDSFLKESMRITGLSTGTLLRLAMKDYTFADGTFIPKGTFVSAATRAIHHDKDIYSDSEEFRPFRFYDLREKDVEGVGKGAKHQVISTSTEFLAFGHGKHACPGRFFAVTEIKAMLAHFLMEYDVKLAPETKALTPTASWDRGSKQYIMIRKRQF
ncbi:cytochrome P450, partial [Wolfiporia cocos MD-104 SS10]